MSDYIIEEFLNLETFEEYIEKYELFADMPRDPRIFAKTMKLMETDANLTHKEKDKLVQKTRRTLLAKLQAELEEIKNGLMTSGVWVAEEDAKSSNKPTKKSTKKTTDISADDLGSVSVRVKYPNGKNGEVDAFILREISIPDEEDPGWLQAELSTDFREEIALIAFPKYRLIQEVDYAAIANDQAMQYLIRHNRIVQAEIKMNEINRLKPIYRNLRSIPDLPLKRLLKSYHEMLRSSRDEIYESLIADGTAKGKWISEQTAFRIVRSHYPDARYQMYFPWLGWQSLDIYIPSKQTAIEYQGKQHFEAVEFFGGEAALADNRERDLRKRKFCEKHGVKVIDWKFDDPLTEEFFAERIMKEIEQ